MKKLYKNKKCYITTCLIFSEVIKNISRLKLIVKNIKEKFSTWDFYGMKNYF